MVIGSLLVWAAMMVNLPDLDQLRWQKRVILVFAPAADDARLQEQRQQFAARREDLSEFDLAVYEVLGSDDAGTDLRQRFKVSKGQFTVVLVGKDGSSKLRESSVVPLDRVLRLIDRMPMRKQEKQDRKG